MKRILIFCDGTWNKPGNVDGGIPVRTNVQLFYKCIVPMDSNNTIQIRYYESGVGTTSSWWDKMMGGLQGLGIDSKIKEAYRFLVDNYEPGDHIFLFGFSRGAYTVRSLAGLIRNCGILQNEYDFKIDQAYDIYRDRSAGSSPDNPEMIRYRTNFAVETDTTIKFIGVWDTVGALGLPLNMFQRANNRKYRFHDVTLGNNVENAFHAIAIDEKRVSFKPAIWELPDRPVNQNLEQRWFCGAHCNVGGSFTDTALSDIALKWLAEKAGLAGLEYRELGSLNNRYYKNEPRPDGPIENSRIRHYKIFPAYIRTMALDYRERNHGKVYTNETVDDSVWARMDAVELGYTSKELKRIRTLFEDARKHVEANNTPTPL